MISPPQLRPVHHVLPDEPLLLMGAGPTPLPEPVARANSTVINHLGPTMGRVLEGVKQMARYAFQTRVDRVVGISGPSSAAMEMALANLAWPGRRVLVLRTGTFSGRLAEIAHGVGATVDVADPPPGHPATAALAREALSRDRYDVVALVQGETSTGVVNHEIPEIAALARENGALVAVDTVCTLTTMPFLMDDWGIDLALTGGQKGLASIPGVSLVAFSERAWEAVMQRPRPMPHWCLDAERAWRFWGQHQYHYTAPVPGVLALYEALRLVCEETLEARIRRHQTCSRALQAGIEGLGLELFVPRAFRLDPVVALSCPPGVNATALRERMVRDFGVEIAGAFGLDIVRIGQMGEQCRPRHLFRTLHALGESLRREGFSADVAGGMAALALALEEAAGC